MSEPKVVPGDEEYISSEEEELDVSTEDLIAEMERRANAAAEDVPIPDEQPEAPETKKEEPPSEPAKIEQAETEASAEAATEEEPPDDKPENTETEEAEESPIERIERLHKREQERISAALELQRAHASRLAGELGYVRKQIDSRQAATESQEVTELSGGDDQRVARLERALAELQQTRAADGVVNAVTEEAQRISTAPDYKDLIEEIKEVSPRYEQDYAQALQSHDGELARLTARAVFGAVLADARALKAERLDKEASERRQAQKERLRQKKISAAPSATGGRSAAPRTKVVSLDDAQIEDIRAEIERRARMRG